MSDTVPTVVDFELGIPLTTPFGAILAGGAVTGDERTGRMVEHFLLYKGLSFQPLNLRLNSACFSGDIFGDTGCDCHWQMSTFLATICASGQGLLIYNLDEEGRGNGVLGKLRSMKASNGGAEGRAAYESIGLPSDTRDYSSSVAILRHLEIGRISLYTNNPHKVKAMERAGIEVATHVALRSHDASLEEYYSRKKRDFGHHV